MERQKLNQLLDQYWEGKLSEEEENELKQSLIAQEPSLDGALKEAAKWFKSTASFKDSLQPSANFDDKVMAKISQQGKTKENWSWWKIAAAVLIIMTLGYTAIVVPTKQKAALAEENTQEDPLKAYEETKATLALMASMMNSSKTQLESLSLFKHAQDKIKHTLETDKSKKDKNS